jgi:hypothetical protein
LAFILIIFFGLLFTLDSCVHEIPIPVDPAEEAGGTTTLTIPSPVIVTCSADTVYFAQTILPLVTSLCGKSGCHGTVNPKEFQMIYTTTSQSYSGIKNRFVTTGSTSTSKLTNAINEMAGKGVSGYVAPTTEQLNTLKKWISQGAKSNSCTGCDTTKYTYAAIVSPIITTYCVGCHPAPGSSSTPNLTTLTAIQAEVNNNPGRLLGSIQHTAPYNTSTTAMPQGSAKLPDCYIRQINKWIDAGMPNN